ncbi:unnamed protein product [Dovyalis caffra]|uniref:Uncharacterized protein n=1 Tax=Dovyalis caffra TaxID=77055 RepID=A0AAV1R0W4_9ROSI|nr:unnamed protein product [Dovyalis caffra]
MDMYVIFRMSWVKDDTLATKETINRVINRLRDFKSELASNFRSSIMSSLEPSRRIWVEDAKLKEVSIRREGKKNISVLFMESKIAKIPPLSHHCLYNSIHTLQSPLIITILNHLITIIKNK